MPKPPSLRLEKEPWRFLCRLLTNAMPVISDHAPAMPPFLKWAGGKRWFVRSYSHLLPKEFGRYFEPFLGSGAVFFYLAPQRAILSDKNVDLVTTYNVLKRNWRGIYRLLENHHAHHNSDYFYLMREARPATAVARAARLLYLNRTCWNGLYRVNQKGEFNVPIGTKSTVVLANDDFAAISRCLRRATIKAQDFEVTLKLAVQGDFVFLDPPYSVAHNNNGFVKYNHQLFSWNDQIRLRNAVRQAIARGVKVLLTNANHDSIRKLYSGIGSHTVVSRASVLAGDATFRRTAQELVICAI